MRAPQTGAPAGGSGAGAPVTTAPTPPLVSGEAICPVCATTFAPRASGGRCPVCNEQVVPEAMVTRDIRAVAPAMRWLREGGWRLVVLVLFILYQAGLLIYLWHSFTDQHLL